MGYKNLARKIRKMSVTCCGITEDSSNPIAHMRHWLTDVDGYTLGGLDVLLVSNYVISTYFQLSSQSTCIRGR